MRVVFTAFRHLTIQQFTERDACGSNRDPQEMQELTSPSS